MGNNLYDELGVKKDATAEEIKNAYRKKAVETHPDKQGGDTKKFQVIAMAYNILKDDAKRSHYDKTGETQMKSLYGKFMHWIDLKLDAIIKNPGQSPVPIKNVNMVTILKGLAMNEMKMLKEKEQEFLDQKELSEYINEHFEYTKDDEDLIDLILKKRIELYVKNLRIIKDEQKMLYDFLEILESYTYEVPPPPKVERVTFRQQLPPHFFTNNG